MSLFERAQDLKEAEKQWQKLNQIWYDPAKVGTTPLDQDDSLQDFVDDLDRRLLPRDFFDWPKASCECGTTKVHGEVPKEAHSEWCPVRK